MPQLDTFIFQNIILTSFFLFILAGYIMFNYNTTNIAKSLKTRYLFTAATESTPKSTDNEALAIELIPSNNVNVCIDEYAQNVKIDAQK